MYTNNRLRRTPECRLSQKVSLLVFFANSHMDTHSDAAMNVIRMIKLFGWEPKVSKEISNKRAEELVWIRRRLILDLLNGTIK